MAYNAFLLVAMSNVFFSLVEYTECTARLVDKIIFVKSNASIWVGMDREREEYANRMTHIRQKKITEKRRRVA